VASRRAWRHPTERSCCFRW